QQLRVSLAFSKAPLAKVLDEIGRQTSLSVVYNVSDIADLRQVSVQAKNEEVGKVLSRVLKGTSVSYSLSNGHIVL
ncbi:STN domain-containing protein, partial [Acinetobacter pittii]|uniref:STN domain-containing protein n=1 Tax=Acinetobacter pittii TaxID=48296 RepID=UPI0028134655